MAASILTSVCAVLATAGVSAFVPSALSVLTTGSSRATPTQQQREYTATCRPMRMSANDVSESRQRFLSDSAAGIVSGAIAITASTGASAPAEAASVSAWEQIELPVAAVLYDIAFDPQHPDHGLVVGAQGTFLEVSCIGRYTLGSLRKRPPVRHKHGFPVLTPIGYCHVSS